jgi:hypothetical protein
MVLDVHGSLAEKFGIILEATQSVVAAHAQGVTNLTVRVAMIERHTRTIGATDGAALGKNGLVLLVLQAI